MTTSLTLDQMKRFVRDHFEEFVNRRNAAVIRKNMTADFYNHDGPGGRPTGAHGDEQMMIGMHKAMPDLRLTIEDMIAEGDKVMCRNGVHTRLRRHCPAPLGAGGQLLGQAISASSACDISRRSFESRSPGRAVKAAVRTSRNSLSGCRPGGFSYFGT